MATFLKANMVGAVDNYTQAENTSGEKLLLFGTRPSQALVPLSTREPIFTVSILNPKHSKIIELRNSPAIPE